MSGLFSAPIHQESDYEKAIAFAGIISGLKQAEVRGSVPYLTRSTGGDTSPVANHRKCLHLDEGNRDLGGVPLRKVKITSSLAFFQGWHNVLPPGGHHEERKP